MNTCELCHNTFPNWIEVDGRKVNLCSRRYCLSCSPRGKHNTHTLSGYPSSLGRTHLCKCGEADPSKFYARMSGTCKKCHNKGIQGRMAKRACMARAYLGGRCLACGFDKWQSCLDVHHLDPKTKDPTAERWRGWSWQRILREIQHCILLCRNCHAAFHAGYNVFKDRCLEAFSVASTTA